MPLLCRLLFQWLSLRLFQRTCIFLWFLQIHYSAWNRIRQLQLKFLSSPLELQLPPVTFWSLEQLSLASSQASDWKEDANNAVVIVQFNCVVSAAVPERVYPLAVDQYLIQLMFRSNQVHPGPLPTIRLRKSLLDKSKVVLLAQVNDMFTIFICCVILNSTYQQSQGDTLGYAC